MATAIHVNRPVHLPPQPLNMQPLGQLIVNFEIREIMTRIAAAVMSVFQAIARFFQAVGQFVVGGCSQVKDWVFGVSPVEQRNRLIAEATRIIEELDPLAPLHEKQNLLVLSLPLLTFQMNRWVKRDRILAVSEIPAQERQAVLLNVHALIPVEQIDGWHTLAMLRTIANIPAQERDAVVGLVRPPLIRAHMDVQEKRVVVEAIAAIQAEQREDVIAHARQLFTARTNGWDMQEILRAVAAIAADQREAVIALARPIITERMNGFDITRILEAINNIPVEQRQDVLALANPWIIPLRGGDERADIIEAITAIQPEQRQGVLALAQAWITEEMSGSEKGAMIRAIGEILPEQRQDVLNLANPLIRQEMGGLERAAIIRAIAGVPADQRLAVLGFVHPLIIQPITGVHIGEMIEVIGAIPANQRQAVLDLATPLIIQAADDRRGANIILAIQAIPADQRQDLLALVRPLITERMNGNDRANLITSVAAIPAEGRADVIAHARPLILEGGDRLSGRIIQAIARIPPGQRAHIIQLAQEFFTPMMDGHGRAFIIEQIFAVPAEERDGYIRDRRRGIHRYIPVINDYAQGLDVHNGNRDRLTLEAVALLLRHQGAIAQERINQANLDFVNYLNASAAFTAQQKQRAQEALLGRGRGWGSFVDEEFFLAGNNERVTGKELIGRLWIFADLRDGEDITNVKNGMIAALEDGRNACGMGKLQRIIVATLQGRIRDVNIEGDVVPQQVTRQDAMNMFFLVPERQNPDIALNVLLEAGNRFCNENPGVNRAHFFEDLNVFAAVGGIV